MLYICKYISPWAGFELITLVVLAFEPPDPSFNNIVKINERHKHGDIPSSQSISTCFVLNTDKSHIEKHNIFIMFIFYTAIWQQYDFIIFMYVGVICMFKTNIRRYSRHRWSNGEHARHECVDLDFRALVGLNERL